MAVETPNLLRRTFWDDLEQQFFLQLLREWATEINFLFADGAPVTNMPLSPEMAMRKQQMSRVGPGLQASGMNGGGNGSSPMG